MTRLDINEFLNKGFEKASMRSIASEVGISAAGLYRHFADKEAMFDILLEPLFEEFKRTYEKMRTRSYKLLEEKMLDEMWEEQTDISLFMDIIYRYYDEFKLLVCCSEGTKYANFIHDFVTMEEKETIELIKAARMQGASVNEIVSKELHLLLSAYYTAIFEVVVHDFEKEEAEHYLDTLQNIFHPGWRAILGL